MDFEEVKERLAHANRLRLLAWTLDARELHELATAELRALQASILEERGRR